MPHGAPANNTVMISDRTLRQDLLEVFADGHGFFTGFLSSYSVKDITTIGIARAMCFVVEHNVTLQMNEPDRFMMLLQKETDHRKKQHSNHRPYVFQRALTGPSFCTTASERVYITANGCEIGFVWPQGLQAAGAGGL